RSEGHARAVRARRGRGRPRRHARTRCAGCPRGEAGIARGRPRLREGAEPRGAAAAARGAGIRGPGRDRAAPGPSRGRGADRRDRLRRGDRERRRGSGRGGDRWYPGCSPQTTPRRAGSLMAERHPSLMEPRIEQLRGRAHSKSPRATRAARRAREINAYYNQLGEAPGRIAPPQVTSVSRKPLSIALEEVASGKIVYERIPFEELEALEAEALAAAAADGVEIDAEPPDDTA